MSSMRAAYSLIFAGLILAFTACQKQEATSATATPTADAPQAMPSKTAALLKKAPDFKLKDQNGVEVSLAAFRGKTVVLEWFNPGCPFVVYAHSKGPLQDMAKKAMDKGVVWLAINSGAPGKQGHGVQANKTAAANWGMNHPILFDEDGTVGRMYGAKTTPHMFVINGKGEMVYRGALDNAPMGDVDGDTPTNYVQGALDALGRQELPEESARSTTPYGCSVKYAG